MGGTGETRAGAPWWPELSLLAAFGVLTAALAAGALLDLDVAVRDWCDTHQPHAAHLLARTLVPLGSSNVLILVALAVALATALRTRSGWPVLPVALAWVAGNALLVPLKMLGDRAAPHSPAPDPELLFHYPPGWSYPSGHAANSVYLFGLVVRLLRWRAPAVVRVVPPVLVGATFSYLGYHWLTDIVAGLLLGGLLELVLRRIPDRPVQRATGRPGDRYASPSSVTTPDS
ncbi:MAG: phosphatase PAP2 family protein [Actinobacteria bacterium]|nr:MAG: phosphatase PAP2 family protein [Actinomycetota bacterium]